MELEDLKSIWKSGETVFQPKNEQEIAMMLKGRSISIVNKLKRNVWFELVFAIVVSVATVALCAFPGTRRYEMDVHFSLIDVPGLYDIFHQEIVGVKPRSGHKRQPS